MIKNLKQTNKYILIVWNKLFLQLDAFVSNLVVTLAIEVRFWCISVSFYLKKYLFIFLCAGFCIDVCDPRQGESTDARGEYGSPGTRVTEDCDLPYGCCEWTLSSLEKVCSNQQTFFPSPEHTSYTFLILIAFLRSRIINIIWL